MICKWLPRCKHPGSVRYPSRFDALMAHIDVEGKWIHVVRCIRCRGWHVLLY